MLERGTPNGAGKTEREYELKRRLEQIEDSTGQKVFNHLGANRALNVFVKCSSTVLELCAVEFFFSFFEHSRVRENHFPRHFERDSDELCIPGMILSAPLGSTAQLYTRAR